MSDEHFERIAAMAENDGTWDLSPNDEAALKWAADEITRLRADLEKAKAVLEFYAYEGWDIHDSTQDGEVEEGAEIQHSRGWADALLEDEGSRARAVLAELDREG